MDLTKFDKFKGQYCKLTKTGSKRSNSRIGVSQFEEGDMSIVEFSVTEEHPVAQFAILVMGPGFYRSMRTSPLVAILEETETTIKVETEGGFYTLEYQGSLNENCQCERCNKDFKLQDLTMKMGGLLCPECRIILFYPGTREYSYEIKRRREEREKAESNS